MLSYDEALQELLNFIPVLKTETRPLTQALDYQLAQDIVATLDHPPLPQSAMDGFAIGVPCELNQLSYDIVGESFAGGALPRALMKGQAIKVATGAPVPPNSFAVVPKEDIQASHDTLTLKSLPDAGRWIRPQGMDVSAGTPLLHSGSRLTPGRLANLAQQGVEAVEVFSPPRVAVVTSGDEIVAPGSPKLQHQIYNSNQTLVSTLLRQNNVELGDCVHICDDQSETVDTLNRLAQEHDLIITTGGASVGERDFLIDALKKNGTLQFWKVKMRPGKPVFGGEFGGTKVLGLPGNPVSTFASFHLFARPLLGHLSGAQTSVLRWSWMPWPDGISPHPIRRDFLRAEWQASNVPNMAGYMLAAGQTSGHGSDLLSTNLLVEIPSLEELPQGPTDYTRVFFL